ncbi:ATPase [Limosilactobacillus fermentum]|uniref:ATP-binding protein n=1 Tax=Limosilactobacillus fermentum TaxID=1613 RepID=UPI000DAAF5ED|nr:ATPase [Limosilactobacillus fermentum]QAR21738.1 ATP-binding protein [Limosilactobacillus fermentum]
MGKMIERGKTMTELMTEQTGGRVTATKLTKRHLLVVGQTGSGKTTTTLALLSQLQQTSQTAIILDPTGEYAKLPNTITYRLGVNAYLEAGALTAPQLLRVLELPADPWLVTKLEAAITALRIQKNLLATPGVYQKWGRLASEFEDQVARLGEWTSDYDLGCLVDQVVEETVHPYPDERADYRLLGQEYDRAALNAHWDQLLALRERLNAPAMRTLFGTVPTPGAVQTELNFVLKMFMTQRSNHKTLVLDLAALKRYGQGQTTVISVLLERLLSFRLAKPGQFAVKLVIDEAHRYLPSNGAALARNGIFQVLREGRKLGLSMIMTTQSPLDLPAELRSQFPNVLVHRLTTPEEQTALGLGSSQEQLATGQVLVYQDGQEVAEGQVNLPDWWGKE